MRGERPARYASRDASCDPPSRMCAGTIPEGTLREERMNAVTDAQRFVGVWELEGIEEGDSFEGGKRGFVSGFESPVGLLIYLPSGFMSVNFAGSSRPPFLREFSPTLSELAAAGTAYGGYAGRWAGVRGRESRRAK